MIFTETNTVEAHLYDLLLGVVSARPGQLAGALASKGGRIAGLEWHHAALAGLPQRNPKSALLPVFQV
ncbi:hypothetical protein [Mesorhizobium sp.]|uniref:hypothetical protein n=1 Tax=Mesorhizobium sp. TaxID=1871066 RepID=UPI000FE963C2|nr:hypothetical protein [Mesorhizobium sp.]RWI99964.1 MAG: hypothetical protein EOR23_31905 [Mesorhizobium sp.]RWM04961.1 MAG: hypothetical protein EOR71_25550 [Mesorhizobium sp.]